MSWQPIETAPKDGTWILAQNAGQLYICSYSNKDGWHLAYSNLRQANPTHWHPLPPEPEAA